MYACLHTRVPCVTVWQLSIKYEHLLGGRRVNLQRIAFSRESSLKTILSVTNVYSLFLSGWWKWPRSTTRWATSPSAKQRDSWSASSQNSHRRNSLSTNGGTSSVCVQSKTRTYFLIPPTTQFGILFSLCRCCDVFHRDRWNVSPWWLPRAVSLEPRGWSTTRSGLRMAGRRERDYYFCSKHDVSCTFLVFRLRTSILSSPSSGFFAVFLLLLLKRPHVLIEYNLYCYDVGIMDCGLVVDLRRGALWSYFLSLFSLIKMTL